MDNVIYSTSNTRNNSINYCTKERFNTYNNKYNDNNFSREYPFYNYFTEI